MPSHSRAARLSLLIKIAPGDSQTAAKLVVVDAQTETTLQLSDVTFLLTLEQDSRGAFTRGQLRSMRSNAVYAIRMSGALFKALTGYVTQGNEY
jgi:hypothetical protein